MKKPSKLPEGQSPKRIEIETPDTEKAKVESESKNIVIGTKEPVSKPKIESKTNINTSSNSGTKKSANTTAPTKPATGKTGTTAPKKPSDLKKKDTEKGDCTIY